MAVTTSSTAATTIQRTCWLELVAYYMDMNSLSDAVHGPFLGHRQQLLHLFPSFVGHIQLLFL